MNVMGNTKGRSTLAGVSAVAILAMAGCSRVKPEELSAELARLRSEMQAEIHRVTQRFSRFFVDGMADGSVRSLDQSVASHLLSGCLNAAAELQNWVADVGEDEGCEIYIKPLFMGILSKR